MQNYNPSNLAHSIPVDQSQHLLHPVPPSPSDIRDKLKKRLLSNSSPVQQMTGSDTVKQGKLTKRSKKDATGGDISEPSCSGTGKDEEKSKGSDKHVHKPDMLTSILNEKKMSLVRDPQVISFLKKFNQELERVRLQK